jgi:hypothetical protein
MSAVDPPQASNGPWNPGIRSQLPSELRCLCTIFRPENVSTSVAGVTELQLLTGFPASDLVAFRPQRLCLHELLIRVTADFSVPDGSRVEDLGINFRQMTGLLLARYLEPQMGAVTSAFDQVRRQMADMIRAALSAVRAPSAPAVAAVTRSPASRLFARMTRRRSEAPTSASNLSWGLREIADCERMASIAGDALERVGYRSLARVMSALYATHGRAWGTPELIVSMASSIACNLHGSNVIGQLMEPILECAARREGYNLLPRQDRPIVINTKGPSASGKSTLRPLQKKLARKIGACWSDFALISPDIWRKQLLDYGALGAAYKYAGAFTSEELQIVDEKLDRYMALKHQRGDMAHLMIDRFRFDSFATDSAEAGSNLLTRFGHSVYLFFMITPPELLVERAWNRGLEVGRYKAVDDTLAHSVEAYAGMPNVFFTWVRRSDKRIQFEFLDNSVRLGELPQTVAFGTNSSLNVLHVKGILDIVRYGRVNVDATSPESLYVDANLLAPEHNTGFLKQCITAFRPVNFADKATGRIYLRIDCGRPVMVDREAFQQAVSDSCTHAGIWAVAPSAFAGTVPVAGRPEFLLGSDGAPPVSTLGHWGNGGG